MSRKSCSCGASGCVVSPGLKCKNNKCLGPKCIREQNVTKIFKSPKNFDTELNIFNKHILDKLDPTESYFISLYEECNDIDYSTIIDLEEKSNCDFGKHPFSDEKEVINTFNIFSSKEEKEKEKEEEKEKKDTTVNDELDWLNYKEDEEEGEQDEDYKKTIKALNFSYLGLTMNNVIDRLDIISILNSLLNIFYGIKILNEAHIYHSDLKPQNIVLDNTDQKFKIIDFGLSIFQGYNIGLDKPMGYTPGYVSPEFVYNKEGDLTNSLIGITGHTLFSYEIDIQKDDEFIFFNPDIYLFDDKKKEFTIIKDDKQIQKLPIKYYSTLSLEKTFFKNDIWSLGYILKFVLNNMVIKLNKKKINNEEEEEFNKKVVYGLNIIINQLLILDVDKRPSAGEALSIYQSFLKLLKISDGGKKTRRKSKKSIKSIKSKKTIKNKRKTNKRYYH